jgi:hypothetical protein
MLPTVSCSDLRGSARQGGGARNLTGGVCTVVAWRRDRDSMARSLSFCDRLYAEDAHLVQEQALVHVEKSYTFNFYN